MQPGRSSPTFRRNVLLHLQDASELLAWLTLVLGCFLLVPYVSTLKKEKVFPSEATVNFYRPV
jgi:hypothetical protein